MLKVRFDIQEKFLIGYRAYDYAPGSQNPSTGGANNTDTPALIYAIQSHFDIKREYNPATGEETNVISENTSDRPWNQRQYMRVDWSRNQAVPVENVDPMDAFLSRAEDQRHRDRRERGFAVQPEPPDLHPRLHRLQPPGDPLARHPRLLPAVRRRRRDRAVGLRRRRDHLPQLADAGPRRPSTSRCRFRTARSCSDDKGKPLRMAFGVDGVIAVHRGAAEGAKG